MPYLAQLAQWLWIPSTAAQAALIYFMLRHRLRGEFTVFFHYTVFQVLSTVAMYPLYRYAWHDTDSWEHEPGGGPAPIQGFVPFLAAVVDDMAEMDYYVGNDAYIPVSMLEYF